jgi:hypothetical protein
MKLVHTDADSVGGALAAKSFSLTDPTIIPLLVLAACRCHLSSTAHFIQDIVVRQHLGTIVGISDNRDKVSVVFVSEPVQCSFF